MGSVISSSLRSGQCCVVHRCILDDDIPSAVDCDVSECAFRSACSLVGEHFKPIGIGTKIPRVTQNAVNSKERAIDYAS